MKLSRLIFSLFLVSYSLNSFAKDELDFSKDVSCSVALPYGERESLTVAATSMGLKLLNLTFIVIQDQSGEFKIKAFKDYKELENAFAELIERDVESSWVSRDMLSYAPETVRKMYAQQKIKNAARYIFTAEARIYQTGNVKLIIKDMLHADYFKDKPNHIAELTTKDDLKLQGKVLAAALNSGSSEVEIRLSCNNAK